MSEPCPRCERDDCAVKEETSNADWTDLVMCLTRTAARALAAEKQLATLAESGTGYSQQTVDAIVKERDALRARVTELEAQLPKPFPWAQCTRCSCQIMATPGGLTGVQSGSLHCPDGKPHEVATILNDKETP